jgi:hypothetical protein
MADLRASAHPPTGPEAEDDLPEPAPLRALRRMVSLLTATLIVGVVIVVGALVLRLIRPAPPPAAALAFDPAALTAAGLVLPFDESVQAAGGAPGAVMLVTRDAAGVERLRVFDAASGAPTAVMRIDRAKP